MIKIRIESDKELKESTITKLREIFDTSKDLGKDLSMAFPKGFTSFDKASYTLKFGKGIMVSFLRIEAFMPEAIEYKDESDRIVYNENNIADY